jgi:hypothetical protein
VIHDSVAGDTCFRFAAHYPNVNARTRRVGHLVSVGLGIIILVVAVSSTGSETRGLQRFSSTGSETRGLQRCATTIFRMLRSGPSPLIRRLTSIGIKDAATNLPQVDMLRV